MAIFCAGALVPEEKYWFSLGMYAHFEIKFFLDFAMKLRKCFGFRNPKRRIGHEHCSQEAGRTDCIWGAKFKIKL